MKKLLKAAKEDLWHKEIEIYSKGVRARKNGAGLAKEIEAKKLNSMSS